MTDALQAKLWAIYDDHIFAWSLGISRLQLQTDNLMAENLLKNATATSNSFSVLAKKALGSSCQPLILKFSPPELLPLLSTDKRGASMDHDHGVTPIEANLGG
ncbi:hypothetical protein V6N12_075055 [Hibiscus sabdariffa]|uniref:Reverse transcriptase RNase H-like domain-containing protein n=1 Tax=Hibiscus sabdariffa TaxID=183260 RepID=A0ABR2BZC7_9ROSI